LLPLLLHFQTANSHRKKYLLMAGEKASGKYFRIADLPQTKENSKHFTHHRNAKLSQYEME